MEELRPIMNQIHADMKCKCISDNFLKVCVKEKAIQVRRIMNKEGWKLFDVLRILDDLCPIRQNISEQWAKWGLQTLGDTEA